MANRTLIEELQWQGWNDDELEELRVQLNKWQQEMKTKKYTQQIRIEWLLDKLEVSEPKIRTYIRLGLQYKMEHPDANLKETYEEVATRFCIADNAVEHAIRYAISKWHKNPQKREFFGLNNDTDRVTNSLLFTTLYDRLRQ